MTKYRTLAINSINLLGLVFLFASFFLLNILGNRYLQGINFDLTANKIYSISAPSKQILAALQDPISIRMYFSKQQAKAYPALVAYASRVKELLADYQRHSNGKLYVDIIAIDKSSGMEAKAIQDGILGIPLEGTNAELFFGIVVSNGEIKEAIEFIEPNKEAYLEEDITKLIYYVGLLDSTRFGPVLQQIKPRGQFSRPLSKVKDLQYIAQAKYQVRADALEQKLQNLKTKITDIDSKKLNVDTEDLLKLSQEEEMAKLELIVTRHQLVEVKNELSHEINALEQKIKLTVIGVVPAVVLLLSLLLWFYQARIASRHANTMFKIFKRSNT